MKLLKTIRSFIVKKIEEQGEFLNNSGIHD